MSLLKDIAYKLFMPSKNVGQVLDVLRGEHKLRRLLKQLISHLTEVVTSTYMN